MSLKNEKTDSLGERVKGFEQVEAKSALDENLPICVRLDGKAFHTFTQGLARPYDERLSRAMVETMKFLIEKTDARLGYTQSDEISLVYFKVASHQQGYFGGRIQKLTSVLASMATAKFNAIVQQTIGEKAEEFAFFDCRVWSVPSLMDAAEVFVWRQEDALKNAISMAAHAHFSHKLLLEKGSAEKIQMLKEKGIDFYAYPDFFKSGTFAQRRSKMVPMPEELKHFRGNEGKEFFVRSEVEQFHLERLRSHPDVTTLLFSPAFEQQQQKSVKQRIRAM